MTIYGQQIRTSIGQKEKKWVETKMAKETGGLQTRNPHGILSVVCGLKHSHNFKNFTNTMRNV